MAKYHSSMVAEKVASLAVECFGGFGFVKEYPVEKLYRDAKIGKIYEGTSFMQLMTIAKIITRIEQTRIIKSLQQKEAFLKWSKIFVGCIICKDKQYILRKT